MKEEAHNETGSILDEEQITVTLAGKEYVWKMPGNRERRRICRVLAKHLEECSKDDPLGMYDAMLDAFYACHEGIQADAECINNNASESEIARAFKAIQEFLNDPLLEEMRLVAQEFPTESDGTEK